MILSFVKVIILRNWYLLKECNNSVILESQGENHSCMSVLKFYIFKEMQNFKIDFAFSLKNRIFGT